MRDFHREMSPVEALSKSVILMDALGRNEWALKYVGRRLNSICMEKYKDAGEKGISIKLPWEGQPHYVQHNAFDDSSYVHELNVAVYRDGPAAGRIKSVNAHHWEYWNSSSNWQDHPEHAIWDKRPPNEKEIQQYEELLDSLTEGGTTEQLDALENTLADVVRRTSGAIQVWYRNTKRAIDGEIEITIGNNPCLRYNKYTLPLRLLNNVLDFSHVFVEAMFSQDGRKRLGLCGEKEPWLLQYLLNLFDVSLDNPLYQNLDASLEYWLYKLFCSCEQYRNFFNSSSTIWWRDAWWRLQEVLSHDNRVSMNLGILKTNKVDVEEDPLCDQVARIGNPSQKMKAESVVDNGEDVYSGYRDGKKIPYVFKVAIVNGVRWSYCDSGVIDLSSSEVVGDLHNGVVVVPGMIDDCQINEIRTIGAASPKSWRKVIVGNTCISTHFENELPSINKGICRSDDSETTLDKITDAISIGVGAFRGWQGLEEIVFERNVLRLGGYAFDDCRHLSKVQFKSASGKIGVRCFRGCPALKEVDLCWTNGIGREAFVGCTTLTAVSARMSWPSEVGDSAFERCNNLKSVDMWSTDNPHEEAKCVTIGKRAFAGCGLLEMVQFSSQMKIVKSEAFVGCPSTCAICHQGTGFLFVGSNAFGDINIDECIYFGKRIKYKDNAEMSLSELLVKLEIGSKAYVQALKEYDYSFVQHHKGKKNLIAAYRREGYFLKDAIDVCLGLAEPYDDRDFDDDYVDYSD